jgi:hypothetical protein
MGDGYLAYLVLRAAQTGISQSIPPLSVVGSPYFLFFFKKKNKIKQPEKKYIYMQLKSCF